MQLGMKKTGVQIDPSCAGSCPAVQVSEKERKLQYDTLFKDVVSILVDKCVNPETNRPYTNTMLERALRDAHFAVDPKHSAKQQALEVGLLQPCWWSGKHAAFQHLEQQTSGYVCLKACPKAQTFHTSPPGSNTTSQLGHSRGWGVE